jgi:hypothetical protein
MCTPVVCSLDIWGGGVLAQRRHCRARVWPFEGPWATVSQAGHGAWSSGDAWPSAVVDSAGFLVVVHADGSEAMQWGWPDWWKKEMLCGGQRRKEKVVVRAGWLDG